MKNVHKSLFLVGFAGLASIAVGAVTETASARTTPAMAGRPWLASEATCFSDFYGQISNSTCPGYKQWQVPAVVDHVYWTNFTVGGIATQFSSDVKCRAIGVGQNGAFWDLNPDVSLTSVNVPQTITVSSYHTAYGAPYLVCNLQNGGRITTVTY